MFAGHLTVTYAARGALKEKLPALRPLFPLLLGALLPDLIDKPLCLLHGGPPRGMAHSAIILALGFWLLIRLMPGRRAMLAAAATGAAFHLIEDCPYPYIFAWPLLGGWEYFPLQGMAEGMLSFYRGETHPYMLAAEAASWPFCIYYWINERALTAAAPAEALRR